MAGNTNFPSVLDTDTELFDVTDTVTAIIDDHHNNIKEAIKAIEKKIGIDSSSVATTLDYRLGNPTGAHKHDGASGQGPRINPTAITLPSGALPVGGANLYDHLMDADVHGLQVIPWYYQGSLPNGASLGSPFSFGKSLSIQSIDARLRRAPSGATTALDINFGPTSLYAASPGLRPIFNAGIRVWSHASPNYITYPSGVQIVVDVDAVGSNDPGQDLSIVFTFRERL